MTIQKHRHHHLMDLDGDGDGRDTADVAVFQAANPSVIGQTKYNADCDIDRDGDVDSADLSAANALYGVNVIPALPGGYISDTNPTTGPDNPIGYDGYIFNSSINTYTVRFRRLFSFSENLFAFFYGS